MQISHKIELKPNNNQKTYFAKALGFSELRRQIEYKTKNKGVEVIVVDRFYPSSKTCSQCGIKKEDLKLSDRTFKCDCGLEIDRDLNASMNLKNKIGRVTAEFTPVEITALRKSVHPISVSSIAETGIEHQISVSKFGQVSNNGSKQESNEKEF